MQRKHGGEPRCSNSCYGLIQDGGRFYGDRTGGAVAQTNAQRVDISVWPDRVWVNRLQKIYGPGWRVDLRAKSAIVDPRDAAVTAPLFTAVVQ